MRTRTMIEADLANVNGIYHASRLKLQEPEKWAPSEEQRLQLEWEYEVAARDRRRLLDELARCGGDRATAEAAEAPP